MLENKTTYTLGDIQGDYIVPKYSKIVSVFLFSDIWIGEVHLQMEMETKC